jgi:hypothetical protein
MAFEGDEEKRGKALEIVIEKIGNDTYEDLNILVYADSAPNSNSKNEMANLSAQQQANNGLMGYQGNLRTFE